MTLGHDPSSPAVPILIADDYEEVRRGLRAILAAEPSLRVVAEARDGREALEMAKTHLPTVVLMDIGMPEMNGVEATRRIRQELPEIQVLIVSLHFSQELLKEAMEAGARGYLLKSDVESELVSAIGSLIRREFYFSPKLHDLQAGPPALPRQTAAGGASTLALHLPRETK